MQLVYVLLGTIVLILNKIRYAVRGYREPRPFAPTDIERAIRYDRSVVQGWCKALKEYAQQEVIGKCVLELGPGADLGPALFLLDAGAKSYITVDAHRLIDQTPNEFYKVLLADTHHQHELQEELHQTLSGNDHRIKYIVDPEFDLSRLPKHTIDLIFSQAAFEHFSDVEKTIRQLSQIVKPGAVLIAEIDLMTHTGILRERDPLNIYRFPRWLYRLVRYAGMPNRIRPGEYQRLFERNGWTDIAIVPLRTLSTKQLEVVHPHLILQFRDSEAQMDVLSFSLRATRKR